ncbi:unnamed protein product [Parnassius apollo]|uniref:(apollo) hypothetical protein n=1 Tax=Parnassius apollo TaxID=110799 RepID=A0A8S3XRH4_PARAO|nr:unnamed protein product [Parnassius apollo]
MTHYVPLIPEEKATCNDVRPLLREVFRGLHPQPVLAEQLQCEQNLNDNKVVNVQVDQWIQQHELESEEMKNREEQLQREYAKRLALESPTDELPSEVASCDSEWKERLGIIRKRLRLVNISKCEVRLAFQPPSRSELQLELLGNRGMTVTSGSTLKLRVHFKPRDVRAINDELLVRVSLGSAVSVPITCYMQPPMLDVIVPSAHTLFSAWGPAAVVHSADALDLGARLLGDVHRVPLQMHCNVDHACFYVMSEEAWCSFTVDEVAIRTGVVVVGAFSIRPALWCGTRDGLAVCRAPSAGLRTAALRILSSTAILRPLNLVADAITFSSEHVSLQNQQRSIDTDTEATNAIRVEPLRGDVAPRSSIAVHVCVPQAGARCGTRRAVLMLILTNVPRESLSPEYEDMIISTETIEEDELPGLSRTGVGKRRVASIVHGHVRIGLEPHRDAAAAELVRRAVARRRVLCTAAAL